MKFLIFDSNRIYAKKVKALLEEHVHGAEVDMAHNVPVLCSRLAANRYDLVLADVDTALDTSSAVRELNRVSVQCKVVLWSSLRSPVTETGRHTRCDAAAVLQKPYDSRAIYYELDKVIAARCED